MSGIQVINCDPSAPPNEGETLTVNYLRHQLPHGILLVNYHLPDVTGTLEIDIVAITYYGIFLLEVKHWLGNITVYDDRWLHEFSGEWRDSPLLSIERKAKVLHSFLRNRGWGDVSVVGMVVLSKGTGSVRGVEDLAARRIFGRHESLVHALTSRDYVFSQSSRILSSDHLPQLAQMIFNSHVANAERHVGGYRILEVRPREHYTELVGEDREFPGRRARIKQYDLPEIGSQRELAEAISRFKRDMAALLNAGPHPNLVLPYQFLRDQDSDERYYLMLEWAGEHTLADKLVADDIPLEEQIRILNDIAAGLDHCHQHGMYHRNLSPASIYFTPNGAAKVGDFDFAKVPSISRTLALTGQQLLQGRHIAPEQALHLSNVDQRADIFSLGVIWYDMLFRPDPTEILDRAQIDQAPLSEDGKTILRMMLAESRQERPETMAEVQEWLSALEA